MNHLLTTTHLLASLRAKIKLAKDQQQVVPIPFFGGRSRPIRPQSGRFRVCLMLNLGTIRLVRDLNPALVPTMHFSLVDSPKVGMQPASPGGYTRTQRKKGSCVVFLTSLQKASNASTMYSSLKIHWLISANISDISPLDAKGMRNIRVGESRVDYPFINAQPYVCSRKRFYTHERLCDHYSKERQKKVTPEQKVKCPVPGWYVTHQPIPIP